MKQLFARRTTPAYGPRHVQHPGWLEYTQTVIVAGHKLRLRPLEKYDGDLWVEMRLHDQPLLEKVEPTTSNWQAAHTLSAWRELLFSLRREAYAGSLVPFAIELDHEFVGQLTLGNIQHGTSSDCTIGYWIFSGHAGKGIGTAACALGVDHAFGRVGVHRVVATHLPENIGSRKVLARNGFREEGYLRKNLHINGAWRDHYLMALTYDDFPNTAIQRLVAASRIQKPAIQRRV